VCPQGHGKVKQVKMPSWFFKLSEYTEPLLRFYEEHPDFVRPASRMNEVVSFVKEGLRDLSISRTNFTWGIPVPDDRKHVMYVWFDALSNYITALGWPDDPEGLYARYWPEAHHVIGKDILRFHAIYWPAMLLAAGLPPPRCVFAHGWLTVNGRKMSKSLRNTVDPLALKWEIGNDPVRYYLMRDTVFGLDGDFNHDSLIDRTNSDLANDLGNLVNRAANLIHKLADGRIPEKRSGGPKEAAVRERAARVCTEAAERFHSFEIARAIETVWTLCAETNRFIQESQPWAMKSEDQKEQRDACLYTMAEAIRQLGVMVSPVMPEKGPEILAQLGLPPDATWPREWGELPPGLALPPPSPVFPRIDKKTVPGIRERLGVDEALAESEQRKPPADGLISIDEFGTVDLLVGLVLGAEPVPKTDKLLKITVDLGEDQPRTLVAGIAQAYPGNSLEGKRIVVVANLRPAKLRGIESRGMLLAATFDDLPRIITVDGNAPPGTKIS
jgi:methionyl-tRNA synthetase